MRLRQLIASKQPSYKLSGEIEADESYFGGGRKGKRGRGAAGKIAVFGLLSVVARSIQPLFLMPRQKRCCLLLKRRSCRIVWYTLIPSKPTMLWMCQVSITCASTSPNSLQIGRTTSMALKISGARLNVIYVNLTASNRVTFIGF